jgi:DNA-binding XRE family transcriptional regulator
MPTKIHPQIECHRMELDGIRYVILRESTYDYICRKAKLKDSGNEKEDFSLIPATGTDRASLAKKLIRRRRAANLSQVELARRAGIRQETLNRIERGRTTPDFATIRKLVIAMNKTEQEQLSETIVHSSGKEK